MKVAQMKRSSRLLLSRSMKETPTILLSFITHTLTYSPVEFHANDGVLVPLVVPGAVAELYNPALCRRVGRARVHEPVGHQHADDGVSVAFHRLQ